MSSKQASGYTYQLDPDQSVAVGVVEAFSEVYDVEPTSLDPLISVLDPDALDNLFKPGTSSNPEVEFQYNGCEIQVNSDRNVLVRETGRKFADGQGT